jgi:uncharacterized protein YeaO (DUF488 family)
MRPCITVSTITVANAFEKHAVQSTMYLRRHSEQPKRGRMIKIKRAYDPPESDDGTRFLIDRIWPRGIKKDSLQVEAWLKDIAPSDTLRKWFAHDPAKWEEFRRRYSAELDSRPRSWQEILGQARKAENVTLVYSAAETRYNNAVALKEYLERRLEESGNSSGRSRITDGGQLRHFRRLPRMTQFCDILQLPFMDYCIDVKAE